MPSIEFNLSSASIADAIREIKEIKTMDLQNAVCEQICDRGVLAAQMVYPTSVAVSRTVKNGIGIIKAESQYICFLEFGTGAYASVPAEGVVAQYPVPIYPGSWSDKHKQTYQKWVDEHGDDKNYPYNRQPVRGLWAAYKVMDAEIKRLNKGDKNG